MPKVFGIHELELKPGVNPPEFERFIAEEAFPALRLPDTVLSLLKGDRGERSGRYLLVFEFPDVAARDRLAPAPNTLGEDTARVVQAAGAIIEKWRSLASMPDTDTTYTDYVEVSKQEGSEQ